MEISISQKNSKMGRIPSVSMTPIKSCGNCSSCAQDCYAMKAYRQYKETRAAYDRNFKCAKSNRTKYFQDIISYLERKAPSAFRWHVAGDILDQFYLDTMKAIASKFKAIKFLCFTKMHHLDFSNCPSNLQIILSMFPSMTLPKSKLPKAWMNDGSETRIPKTAIDCFGRCDTCGMCFNLKKLHRDVVFEKH